MIAPAATSYDPKRMIRMKTLLPMFALGKRMETDEIFEVEAQAVGEIEATNRARIADVNDRVLVYKIVECF